MMDFLLILVDSCPVHWFLTVLHIFLWRQTIFLNSKSLPGYQPCLLLNKHEILGSQIKALLVWIARTMESYHQCNNHNFPFVNITRKKLPVSAAVQQWNLLLSCHVLGCHVMKCCHCLRTALHNTNRLNLLFSSIVTNPVSLCVNEARFDNWTFVMRSSLHTIRPPSYLVTCLPWDMCITSDASLSTLIVLQQN